MNHSISGDEYRCKKTAKIRRNKLRKNKEKMKKKRKRDKKNKSKSKRKKQPRKHRYWRLLIMIALFIEYV